MKRHYVLLSAMLMLFALNGCGVNNGTTPGSNSTLENGANSSYNDDAVVGNGGNSDVGTQPNDNVNNSVNGNNGTAENGAPNGALSGTNSAGTTAARNGRVSTGTAMAEPRLTNNHGTKLYRTTNYDQMLRNGRVHDTDGVLTDWENSMTPGITH